jgi:hypothetical protein
MIWAGYFYALYGLIKKWKMPAAAFTMWHNKMQPIYFWRIKNNAARFFK